MSTQMNDPLTLPCGQVLDNRLAKSAMSERLASPAGAPTKGLVRLYEQWSRGGAGLLITGNVMVDRGALGESGNVVVDDERDLTALALWARAARDGGAKLWMQINHPGRQSPRTLSPKPVAPSAVRLKGAGPAFATPRALEPVEIEAIIERFATTAAVAERAGFDGVEIHGAHGYLVSQFLSPRINLRDDNWGGDAERRRRFLLEVVRAVRVAVSPGFAVGVKLNSADFQRGGFDTSESLAVLEALDRESIDLLEISGGTYESAAMFEETVPKGESSRAREAYFLTYAEDARTRVATPLMLTGGFRTREGISTALGGGVVDVVGLARPMAAEPDLPGRLCRGEVDHAKPIRLATGSKKLDGLVQAAWYQMQLNHMARGLSPKLKAGRLSAIFRYVVPRRAPREDRAWALAPAPADVGPRDAAARPSITRDVR
jgi:2,4-dienoyl-CoA reductase-like NADH-dependent reductase (Old Yellow Enzyme family)